MAARGWAAAESPLQIGQALVAWPLLGRLAKIESDDGITIPTSLGVSVHTIPPATVFGSLDFPNDGWQTTVIIVIIVIGYNKFSIMYTSEARQVSSHHG
jgi:hypothetical protein